jgi:hypothetical protein
MLKPLKWLFFLVLALPGLALAQQARPFDPGQVASGGPIDGSALVLLLVRAVQDGQWLLVLSLVVIGSVWFSRSFLGPYVPWLATSRGGAVLSLVGGQAAAFANAAVTGQMGMETLVRGLVAAFIASGGWSLIKAILPEPKREHLGEDQGLGTAARGP